MTRDECILCGFDGAWVGNIENIDDELFGLSRWEILELMNAELILLLRDVKHLNDG